MPSENFSNWLWVKVHTFWEGHKILRNLQSWFDRYYIGQNLRWKFCKNLWPSQNIWTLCKRKETNLKVKIRLRLVLAIINKGVLKVISFLGFGFGFLSLGFSFRNTFRGFWIFQMFFVILIFFVKLKKTPKSLNYFLKTTQ